MYDFRSGAAVRGGVNGSGASVTDSAEASLDDSDSADIKAVSV